MTNNSLMISAGLAKVTYLTKQAHLIVLFYFKRWGYSRRECESSYIIYYIYVVLEEILIYRYRYINAS